MKDKIVATGVFTKLAWPNSDRGMYLEVPTVDFAIRLESVGDMKMWGNPGDMMGAKVKITIERVKD